MPHRYVIRHVTQFTYDTPVSESVMEVRMQPSTSDLQQCLDFAIEAQPRARVFGYRDFLDNAVHHFNVPRRHRQLVITARAHVEVHEPPPLPATLDAECWRAIGTWTESCEHWDFRQPSHFAHPSPALLSFLDAAGLRERPADPLTSCRHIMSAIHERFEYAPNSTRVDSPIEEAIASGRGVCQDFAHLMIAALRHLSMPARYVSGYIAPADPDAPTPTSVATHAWVETCLPQFGWIGFDPTHNVVTSGRHVRIAVGRDYADVPPTRGVFKGTAGSALSVAVEIRPANRFVSSLKDADAPAPLPPSTPVAAQGEPDIQQQQQQQ